MASYFLSSSGDDDTGDGSRGNPWFSIDKAGNNSVAGDVVWIKADGEYNLTNRFLANTGGGSDDNFRYWIGYSDWASCNEANKTSDIDTGSTYALLKNNAQTGLSQVYMTGIITCKNQIWRNLEFKQHVTGNDWWFEITGGGSYGGWLFKHCKNNNCHELIKFGGAMGGLTMVDCDFDKNESTVCEIDSAYLRARNCIFDFISNVSMGSKYNFQVLYKCKFRRYDSAHAIIACTGINPTADSDTVETLDDGAVIWDSILKANSAYYCVRRATAGNSVITDLDYNCLYNSTANVYVLFVSKNPQFNLENVDPELTADLRPVKASVLRGGVPDINGNPDQIGAIRQKYQFANRGRIVNRGKLWVIR